MGKQVSQFTVCQCRFLSIFTGHIHIHQSTIIIVISKSYLLEILSVRGSGGEDESHSIQSRSQGTVGSSQ